VHPENFLEEIPIEVDHYTAANTGKTSKTRYQHYSKDSLKQKYFPIILFMEKTHTDTNGQLMLGTNHDDLHFLQQRNNIKSKCMKNIGICAD
jgi:hypothetical protein